jgi:hypothetical protein
MDSLGSKCECVRSILILVIGLKVDDWGATPVSSVQSAHGDAMGDSAELGAARATVLHFWSGFTLQDRRIVGIPLCSHWTVIADAVWLGAVWRPSSGFGDIGSGHRWCSNLVSFVYSGGEARGSSSGVWFGSMVDLLVFFVMWMNSRVSRWTIYRGEATCHIPKFSFRNVNHFSHKKLKISKRIHLF